MSVHEVLCVTLVYMSLESVCGPEDDGPHTIKREHRRPCVVDIMCVND